jgi:RNA polymerase sigma factor (sigma-70 family)
MATAQTHPILRGIRQLAAGHLVAGLPDAELLERFATQHDEAAFAALVRRHGSLVLGVCRRKAGSLEDPRALAAWLYGVAWRTARKARAREARRIACQRQTARPEAVELPDDLEWRDLRPVLDEAIGSLPDSYRVPFILHYLQGATVSAVARQLGWPRGTVATRLARARERLRLRLERRGLALSAGTLAVVLSGGRASAGVAGEVLRSTVQAAMVAAGKGGSAGGLSAIAAALAQGGEKVMGTMKLKVGAVLLLAVGLAGGGVALSEPRTPAGASPAPAGGNASRPAGNVREEDWALFFRGSTYFLLGDYREADAPFSRLARMHPDSPLAPTAAELAVLAKNLGAGAEDDGGRKAAEGRRFIKAALPDEVHDLPAGEAERDFKLAEFYRRLGHAGTAYFYYQLVSRRCPGTELAARAEEQLRELRKKAEEERKAAEQGPLRVGQVLVVGNRKTPQSVILDQVQLYPGQVLVLAELRAAERRLERLNPRWCLFLESPTPPTRTRMEGSPG